jgi:hypothetical protein
MDAVHAAKLEPVREWLEDRMDNRTREDLLAKLAEARKQEAQSRERFHSQAASIEKVRETLGNPYFYSGRPADDPESESRYTGYKSHEPTLVLWREWQDLSQQVAAIRKELLDAGIDAG